jgi:hypothetical protein
MPPAAYATCRLRIITAEMGLLDICARRHEAAFAASDGDVSESFHQTWDKAIADWWSLAEEAEALSADLGPASPALAGIAEAMDRMLQVSLTGPC